MISSILLFLNPILEFLQETTPGTPGSDGEGSGPGNLLVPMVLIMGIFYFVLIAPERKKQKRREAMLATMKKGERVMTTSGMYGSVVQIKDDVVTLQVADNVRLRFSRSAVQSLLDRDEKGNDKDTKDLPEAEETLEAK